MSWPSTRTRPASGFRRPTTIFRVVVFPAPFGPIRPNTSADRTSREMPSTAVFPSYRFHKFSITRAGARPCIVVRYRGGRDKDAAVIVRSRPGTVYPTGHTPDRSPKGLPELLDRVRHHVQDALQVIEELLEAVRRHRALRGRLDEPLLLQDPQAVPDLVLGDVQHLAQPDDPDRLVLVDRLQHLDVALEELHLDLDLARQNGLPRQRKLPRARSSMGHDNACRFKRCGFAARTSRTRSSTTPWSD